MRKMLLALLFVAGCPSSKIERGGASLQRIPAPSARERERGLRLRYGTPLSPDARTERMRIAREEAQRWSHLLPQTGRRPLFSNTPVDAWTNLGPSNAVLDPGDPSVDSGRVNMIAVDPRSAEVVYVATPGGVWKTTAFGTTFDWKPLTDGLWNIAVGAMALDPNSPDILYIGVGDQVPTDYQLTGAAVGNTVLKSNDGGATWSDPKSIAGVYTAVKNTPARPTQFRDFKIDPTDSRHLLVATDAGLFQSSDAGATFTLVQLASSSGAPVVTEMWSIAFLGAKSWLVTGLDDPDGGDFWRSSDSGANWTSLRGAAALPSIGQDGIGRVTLAAGTVKAPSTVVYAFASDLNGRRTAGFWRSTDGGLHFQDATGMLGNPTSNDNDCVDMNIGHDQSDYNQALAVDPRDDAHVFAGGNLCAVRTRNGLDAIPTWDNIAHWNPAHGGGNVNGGTLPYAHADFHTALAFTTGSGARLFAGNDGGLFTSDNVFDATPTSVIWADHNRGLSTFLCYSLGTGDPADGDADVMLSGTQDNGTRLGAPAPTFAVVLGGDGIGTATHNGLHGQWLWGGGPYNQPGDFSACNNAISDCLLRESWHYVEPPIADDDTYPGFFLSYAPVQTDPAGEAFLTFSFFTVFKSSVGARGPSWTPLARMNAGINAIFASQTIPGLYGVALHDGFFAVTSDETHWDVSSNIPTTLGAEIYQMSSIAFPAVTPAGAKPGDVYLGSSAAGQLANGTPIPDRLGHLFLTHDRGQTFTPLHGNGTGHDLPNLPVHVVRYDPADPSGNIIYVGTELGVYRTRDGGTTWERYGTGLPLVRINDLALSRNQSLIRVATYGRGLWETHPTLTRKTPGGGDFNLDGAIDFVDLGALTSRLGTVPDGDGWPTYSWSVDLVHGTDLTTTRIDDTDLTALLTNFGGTP